MTIPNSVEELLKRWHKRLRELQFSQYEAARYLKIWHYAIGISAVLISGFVSSQVFTSLKDQLSPDFKVFLGLFTLLGTLLTALQTFLKLMDRSEKHKLAGAKAANLRRRIEQLIVSGDLNNISQTTLDGIREAYDVVSSESPEVLGWLYAKVSAKLERDQ